MTESQIARVRMFNDQLRRAGVGGQVLITRGVQALGPDRLATVVQAIRVFDDFNADNDPYGEHDFAVLRVEGVEVIFKIDYYDLNMDSMSPDPSDPAVTRRVMTILLPVEY
jgi:hypothetical protein